MEILKQLDEILKFDPQGQSVFYKKVFAQAVEEGVLDSQGNVIPEITEENNPELFSMVMRAQHDHSQRHK